MFAKHPMTENLQGFSGESGYFLLSLCVRPLNYNLWRCVLLGTMVCFF